eukprot:CAMPEP_0113819516 /NCGR_PEP_ID=MMETSP0328-20130328/778_1 /TAXON_ID=39455 /ORGANISM="Alexandrium minutum" /LENGTH=56 /DNA_ID=CAMNT_0000787449 /DNA_START=263 /DNA_END=433 /DNA_ORIENTATION=+ /assembly_acc=CAM_ASM_000350
MLFLSSLRIVLGSNSSYLFSDLAPTCSSRFSLFEEQLQHLVCPAEPETPEEASNTE